MPCCFSLLSCLASVKEPASERMLRRSILCLLRRSCAVPVASTQALDFGRRFSSKELSGALSNEERARAYLKEYGLGPHVSLQSPSSRETPPESDAGGTGRSARNLPQVGGSPPTSSELASFLERDGGALDVVDLDVSTKATYTNHLVISTGRSPAHLRDLAERVTHKLRQCSVTVDGDPVNFSPAESDWITVDAGLTVIHLFLQDSRAMYALEELWTSEVSQAGEDWNTSADDELEIKSYRPKPA
jgi:ribosome silencing factor RsfS/YbeB/iojap